jgi:hypothetical protein
MALHICMRENPVDRVMYPRSPISRVLNARYPYSLDGALISLFVPH